MAGLRVFRKGKVFDSADLVHRRGESLCLPNHKCSTFNLTTVFRWSDYRVIYFDDDICHSATVHHIGFYNLEYAQTGEGNEKENYGGSSTNTTAPPNKPMYKRWARRLQLN